MPLCGLATIPGSDLDLQELPQTQHHQLLYSTGCGQVQGACSAWLLRDAAGDAHMSAPLSRPTVHNRQRLVLKPRC